MRDVIDLLRRAEVLLDLQHCAAHAPELEAKRVDLANLRGGLDNITLLLVEAGKATEGRPSAPRQRLWMKSIVRLVSKAPSEWWWFLAGVTTAGVGAALFRWGNWQLNIGVLTIALVLLGVALGTSVRRRKKLASKQALKELVPDAGAPVHRSRNCKIDKALIDMVAKEEQRLRELAIEQSWRVAWDELSPVHDKAENFLAADDLTAAFREYCRAVSILSIGLRKHQDKHEVLIPHWDRRQK